VDDKGPPTLVANSRDTLVDQHSCKMGTRGQEVKTSSSGLPDIQIRDTYSESLSEEALGTVLGGSFGGRYSDS